MSEPTHYLRIEGVNLSRFVFDTRDLSTIRGGGLLLLDAARMLPEHLQNRFSAARITPIAVGASSCVLAIETDNPYAIRTEAVAHLRGPGENPLAHATFTVALVERTPGDFPADRERLLALTRFRQMQQSSLAVPPAQTDPRTGICEVDGVRPIGRDSIERRKGRNVVQTPASPSTQRRHARGRRAKQDFYARYSHCADGEMPHDFAHHFEDIADSREHGSLNQKMAVFYADGNKFGSIERQRVHEEKDLTELDDFFQKRRKTLLTALLRDEVLNAGKAADWVNGRCPRDPDHADILESRYRFETLLWGADESMFVMPAWAAWRFAARFFAHTQDWNLKDARLSQTVDQPLTHSAALIFCQHHAPIHRLKDLAKEKMCEFAKGLKDRNGNEIGRGRNQLVYQVLESFDHLGTEYEAAIARRLGEIAPPDRLVLADEAGDGKTLAQKMDAIAGGLATLRGSEFPRSQLRALASSLIRGTPGANADYQRHRDRFVKGDDATRAEVGGALDGIHECFSSADGAFWYHIEELWDYARR